MPDGWLCPAAALGAVAKVVGIRVTRSPNA
jgi:hypothetical protein